MTRFTAESILKLARENGTLEICAICEEEIKRQIMSANGGSSLVKRYNAAVKYIKAIDDNRPELKGAYPIEYHGKDNCQAMCDGFTGVILYNPIDGLQQVTCEPIRLDTILGDIPESHQIIDVDMVDVIVSIKGHNKYERITYSIGQQLFNPKLLVEICSILGDNLKFYVSGKEDSSMMYVTNDNGIAIICPVRK